MQKPARHFLILLALMIALLIVGLAVLFLLATDRLPPPNPIELTATWVVSLHDDGVARLWRTETAAAHRIESALQATQTVAAREPCAFVWATHPLPELSGRMQAALVEAGIEDVTVSAAAYGENCWNNDGSLRYFATMQTNFHLTAKVDDLNDDETLGNRAAAILRVLAEFPADEVPGSNPGVISLAFQVGDNERRLQFSEMQAIEALGEGLSGAALIEALGSWYDDQST